VAVGVHPKHALDFGDFYFDRLSRLLDSPAVAALGEVGTREPKVGSRVGVRPEFDCGLIPIETMEVDTLQGIGDFVQRQAQYLPV
jgi:hypothetical protein